MRYLNFSVLFRVVVFITPNILIPLSVGTLSSIALLPCVSFISTVFLDSFSSLSMCSSPVSLNLHISRKYELLRNSKIPPVDYSNLFHVPVLCHICIISSSAGAALFSFLCSKVLLSTNMSASNLVFMVSVEFFSLYP